MQHSYFTAINDDWKKIVVTTALCVRNNHSITVVSMDRCLKLQHWPSNGLTLINKSYVADCIIFHFEINIAAKTDITDWTDSNESNKWHSPHWSQQRNAFILNVSKTLLMHKTMYNQLGRNWFVMKNSRLNMNMQYIETGNAMSQNEKAPIFRIRF